MQTNDGSLTLDALANAFGGTSMTTGLMLAREDMFDAIEWVVVGCSTSGGWLIRSTRAGVIVGECSDSAVAKYVEQLEAALAHPQYDDNLVFLDGYIFYVGLVRNSHQTRYVASTAKVEPRFMRLTDVLFDLTRDELIAQMSEPRNLAP